MARWCGSVAICVGGLREAALAAVGWNPGGGCWVLGPPQLGAPANKKTIICRQVSYVNNQVTTERQHISLGNSKVTQSIDKVKYTE